MVSGAETPVEIEPQFDPEITEYEAQYTTGQTVKITATPVYRNATIAIKAGNEQNPNIKINPSRISGGTVEMGTRNSSSTAGAAGIAMPFFLTFQATYGVQEGRTYKVNIVSAD